MILHQVWQTDAKCCLSVLLLRNKLSCSPLYINLPLFFCFLVASHFPPAAKLHPPHCRDLFACACVHGVLNTKISDFTGQLFKACFML